MGPRSDERGNDECRSVRVKADFVTSMGPRSDERGNFCRLEGAELLFATLLQWGRAPMSAEMRPDAPPR